MKSNVQMKKNKEVAERNIKRYMLLGKVAIPREAWGLPRGILKDEEKRLMKWARRKELHTKFFHLRFEYSQEERNGKKIVVHSSAIKDDRELDGAKLMDLIAIEHRKEQHHGEEKWVCNEGTVVSVGKRFQKGEEIRFESRAIGVSKCHPGENFNKLLGRVMAFIDTKNQFEAAEKKLMIEKSKEYLSNLKKIDSENVIVVDEKKEISDHITRTWQPSSSFQGKGTHSGKHPDDTSLSVQEAVDSGFLIVEEDVHELKKVYEKAADSLAMAWPLIKKAKAEGLDVTRSDELIKEARKALRAKQCQKSLELSNLSIDLILSPIERKKKKCDEVRHGINTIMDGVRIFGEIKGVGLLLVHEAETLIHKAEMEYNTEDYDEATQFKKSEKSLVQLKQQYLYKQVEFIYSHAESLVNEIEKTGKFVPGIASALLKAKDALDYEDYDDVIFYAVQIKTLIDDKERGRRINA